MSTQKNQKKELPPYDDKEREDKLGSRSSLAKKNSDYPKLPNSHTKRDQGRKSK